MRSYEEFLSVHVTLANHYHKSRLAMAEDSNVCCQLIQRFSKASISWNYFVIAHWYLHICCTPLYARPHSLLVLLTLYRVIQIRRTLLKEVVGAENISNFFFFFLDSSPFLIDAFLKLMSFCRPNLFLMPDRIYSGILLPYCGTELTATHQSI